MSGAAAARGGEAPTIAPTPVHGDARGAGALCACAAPLRPLVQRAVAGALGANRSDGLEKADEEALLAASAAVRAQGLGAERLVLALKAVWRELPDAHRLPPCESEAALGRLVTRGIRLFYAPRDAPGSRVPLMLPPPGAGAGPRDATARP